MVLNYYFYYNILNVTYNYLYIFLVNLNIQSINIIIVILLIITFFQFNIKLKYIINYYIYCYFNLCIVFKKNILGIYTKLLPNTLLIGLNNIHPIIYYIGVVSLIIYVFSYYTLLKNTINLEIIFYLLSLSLLLGMDWGSINGSWSFFWVNDYIEIVLLMWCFLLFMLLHSYIDKNKLIYIVYTVLILFIIIYCLRMGFLSTRHSFFINLKIYSYPIYCLLWLPIILLLSNYYSIILYYFILCNFIIYSTISYVATLFAYIGVFLFNYVVFFFRKYYFILHLVILIYLYMWLMQINNNTYIYINNYFLKSKSYLYIYNTALFCNNYLVLYTHNIIKNISIIHISYINFIYLFNSKVINNILYKSLLTYSYVFLIFNFILFSICKIYV